MTVEEVKKLKNENLVEIIACYRGWGLQKKFDETWEWISPSDWKKSLCSFGPPDYSEDLNALWDLWLWLPKDKRVVYSHYLLETTNYVHRTLGDVYNASPRERAEAFVLMIKN